MGVSLPTTTTQLLLIPYMALLVHLVVSLDVVRVAAALLVGQQVGLFSLHSDTSCLALLSSYFSNL